MESRLVALLDAGTVAALVSGMSYETRYWTAKRQAALRDTPEALRWRLADNEAKTLAEAEAPLPTAEEIEASSNPAQLVIDRLASFNTARDQHRSRLLGEKA